MMAETNQKQATELQMLNETDNRLKQRYTTKHKLHHTVNLKKGKTINRVH